MTKRFLILSNVYPSKRTPTQGVFVKNIEQALLNRGVDVQRVVLAGRHDNYLAKAIHYLAYIIRAFCRLLFTQRVVYLHYVAHSSIPFLLASLFTKMKLVAHVHGGDVLPANYEIEPVRKIKIWLARKTLQKATMIVVPSRYFKDFLIAEFNTESSRIEINPSGGVDTKTFSNMNKATPSFIENRKLILGYVGRLDSGKGIDTLIHAMNQLGLSFHCHFIGAGLYRDKFETLAAKYGLTESVTFHGGIKQQQLAQYYRSFDYLVFPSEMLESLGLVGLEAMACGTPVIGSMNAGMADYLEHGVNGFGFASADAASLAACINHASQVSAEDYQTLSEQARKTSLAFDAELSNQQLLKILQ